MFDFKIRAYGRTELAQAYAPELSPKGAWKRLQTWIAINSELSQRLQELSQNHNSRIFTPAQVQAIVDCLGEP